MLYMYQLIFIVTVWGRYYYYLYFTDQESKPQRDYMTANITQLENGRAGIQIQAEALQNAIS